MPKTRRIIMALGILVLVGGLHSHVVHYREFLGERNGVCAGAFTGDGKWELTVFARPKLVHPDIPVLRLGFINIGVRGERDWRVDMSGHFFAGAAILLVPSLAFEVRSRYRRPSAGFPVESKKNPAHAGGVDTSPLE